MKARTHIVINEKGSSNVMILDDSNPEGSTLTIKDNSPYGTQNHINLSRIQMIESLEYMIRHLKANISSNSSEET